MRGSFSGGRDGPELYLRNIDRLGLHVSMQFKNCSNVKKCLMQEKVLNLTITGYLPTRNTYGITV